ncbi:Ig kappa chain V region 3368 [Labeo rohita]|uniref:Ig kappa chain V region 3368 n=1 Tax=Labeo rohita TaxID=84645 RepID=A0ABQ8L0Z6_LABRO|nr:Ig kappa chain V region 3368 [Labeo rohita]
MSVSLKELCQMVNVPYDQARALIESESSDGESVEREEATMEDTVMEDTVVHADLSGGLEGEEASLLAPEQVQFDTGRVCVTGFYVVNLINFHLIDVLVCSQAAVSDLLTDLGSNMTINCDLDENEVYWILLKTADPPTLILRTFPTPIPPHYYDKMLRKKYSVQFKHTLVISNVTSDELGVYYCMNTRTPPKLSNSTRLRFNVTEQNQTQWKTIIIIFGLMNGLLVIVVVGLVKVFVVGNRRSAEQSQLSTDLQQMQVTEQHQDQLHLKLIILLFQYAEVNFSKLRRNIRSSQINSTYAALNLPKS